MDNIINIKNLSVSIGGKKILNNLDLNINSNDLYAICGISGSGKTTIIKSILNEVDFDGDITVLGQDVNKKNINYIRKNVSVLLDNPSDMFITEVGRKEYLLELKNLKYDMKSANKKIDERVKLLNMEKFIDKNISCLSGGEKQIIALGLLLLKQPKILLLDSPFEMLDEKEKTKIESILKKISKDTTVILFLNNLEESLICRRIYVLSKGKFILYGVKRRILKKEAEIKSSGLKLPIMADLSIKLGYYNLLDNIILDVDKMVNKLWK